MPNWAEQREALVEHLSERESLDSGTLRALRAVPRHQFVPEPRRQAAYEDRPLPIGSGQTISAPHMVAVMTDLLALQSATNVLEIGTGCGYHAAVTAECVGAENVYSVEYHDDLAERARDTLARVGYDGIEVRSGDGKEGWPEHAPFDRAYFTCAADEFPQPVVDQVSSGGRLLAPIGTRSQTLVLARKRDDGTLAREKHGQVRFVPLQ
jgi:protein-L-isoaspartate(D-aspartate) O-methyltransferase